MRHTDIRIKNLVRENWNELESPSFIHCRLLQRGLGKAGARSSLEIGEKRKIRILISDHTLSHTQSSRVSGEEDGENESQEKKLQSKINGCDLLSWLSYFAFFPSSSFNFLSGWKTI